MDLYNSNGAKFRTLLAVEQGRKMKIIYGYLYRFAKMLPETKKFLFTTKALSFTIYDLLFIIVIDYLIFLRGSQCPLRLRSRQAF